jgi:transcriptional regulator with XRE-family HTH domain
VNTVERFRQRLRQALLALGLSLGREVEQQEIARAIGMSPSRVNRYFRDNTPPLDVIVLLARALQVDPGWLAFGEDCHPSTYPTWFTPQVSTDADRLEARAKNGLAHARGARPQSSRARRRSG